MTLGIFFASPLLIVIGIIWCAHIAFNRLLGYGLKYSSRMGVTHLGLIGSRQEPAEQNSMNDAARGGVRTLLRIEGFFFLLVALFAYCKLGLGWKIFALFFFAPDIAFLGYLAGSTVGAFCYNITHSFVGATLTLLFGMLSHIHLAVVAGIIWSAHIGFDRALGYGLKYSKGFGFTHLGLIGRAKREAVEL